MNGSLIGDDNNECVCVSSNSSSLGNYMLYFGHFESEK